LEKYGLPFILLLDLEGKLVGALCVRGVTGRTRRVTFIIDGKGVVVKVG
jgi:peroxiredoxin